MPERKRPPPPAPTTRIGSKATHTKASWSTPVKDHVTPTTLDNTLVNIRSETAELINTARERSQVTTQGFIMTKFERFSANVGLPHGQSSHLPTAGNGAYRGSDIHNTHVYELDPYIFDEEEPRHGQFDDNSLSRSLRTHAPTFTTEITFFRDQTGLY
jgi:hypothetical protein